METVPGSVVRSAASWKPVNQSMVVGPYFAAVSLIAVATVGVVFLRKKAEKTP